MVLQEKTKISIISALHDLGNNEFVDKPFRVKQIANAIFTKRVFDFKQISNIPLNLRIITKLLCARHNSHKQTGVQRRDSEIFV